MPADGVDADGNLNARYGVPNAEAAQLAGLLKATAERIENGLRGAELQTVFQKGWIASIPDAD